MNNGCRLIAALLVLNSGWAHSLAAEPPVTALAIAAAQDVVICGSQAGVQIRRLADLQTVGTLDCDLDQIHDLEFSPDGSLLAVAGGDPSEFGVVEVFGWPDQQRVWRTGDHQDVVMDVEFSPDGRYLATASLDQTGLILTADTGVLVTTLTGHSKGLTCVCWLPDSAQLLTGSLDHSLRVWQADSGQIIRTLNNHVQPVLDVALQPGSTSGLPLVASTGRDRTVRFWQPTIGRMVRFARLPAVAQTLAWSDQSTALIAAGQDGVVRTIDPVSLEVSVAAEPTDGWLYSCRTVANSQQVLLGTSTGQVLRLEIP